MPLLDETAAMLVMGYSFGTDRRRRTGSRVFPTRILGRPAVCAIGEDAVRTLYDPALFQRGDVLPRPIQATLTGVGSVHTLDGSAHEHRKAMFIATTRSGLDDLSARTAKAWDEACDRWRPGEEVVLFDEAARAITAGVATWAGVPVGEREARLRAADMIAMVDGFATLGPRHFRARRARQRAERWLEEIVAAVRAGRQPAEPDSALAVVAGHRDDNGDLLGPRLCAVELLNLIRPAVAVAWFVMFAGDAMRRLPHIRERLLTPDEGYLEGFIHELRRFYPFAPYVAGSARVDKSTAAEISVRRGDLLVIDIYGHHRDPRRWTDPLRFRPERFETTEIGAYDLIPQGGGDPATGHRCPGEPATIDILKTLVPRLASFEHHTPPQDMSISLRRIPARVKSGHVMTPTPSRTKPASDPVVAAKPTSWP